MDWVSICALVLTGIDAINADCGTPEIQATRVIAGKEAVRGSWPWQVLLLLNSLPFCGGTLISPRWIVTSADCLIGKQRSKNLISVRVGEHKARFDEGSEVNHAVEKMILHPDFEIPSPQNNDIALIKLQQPVTFNIYVQPACPPSSDPPVGSKCYITGWGNIEHPGRMFPILQQGQLPIVSNSVCAAKNMIVNGYIEITEAMVCAGSDGSSLTSGCHGDSGGPLICNLNGHWELQGAVSHGSENCESAKAYTVFARIFYFKRWILDQMAEV